MFVIEMIEYAAFMYLRALSFNNILAILRAWYGKRVFSKNVLIDRIEQLADLIPDNQEVSRWLSVKRSGYFALDGTWLKYRGQDIVLLILFDVQTLDVVSWNVASEESEESYQKLIDQAKWEIMAYVKGFFCDGDSGLLKALKKNFPGRRIQLCVFHKYSRVGQIISFVLARTEIDKEIKRQTEKILFAPSKREAIGVLKRNFDLLLTHFDDPAMSAYNNALEGFNHILKRKLTLMKGFKKQVNINRWLKLILLDWRFHVLSESAFKDRRGKSPLQLAGANLPPIYNWMTFIRKNYPKKPH